jgi:hypothetical protein
MAATICSALVRGVARSSRAMICGIGVASRATALRIWVPPRSMPR